MLPFRAVGLVCAGHILCKSTIHKQFSRQTYGGSLNSLSVRPGVVVSFVCLSRCGNFKCLSVQVWQSHLSVCAGVKEYSTAIDMWSVGCIMGELILNAPLLSGKSEMEQIHKIFNLVGSPTVQNWPKHQDLPNLKRVRHQLKARKSKTKQKQKNKKEKNGKEKKRKETWWAVLLLRTGLSTRTCQISRG